MIDLHNAAQAVVPSSAPPFGKQEPQTIDLRELALGGCRCAGNILNQTLAFSSHGNSTTLQANGRIGPGSHEVRVCDTA